MQNAYTKRSRKLILVALEPRLFSEAIGDAIQNLRPNLEVEVVEPDDLASEVERQNPPLVLCGGPEPEDGPDGLVWIEYRPHDDARAIIYARGQRLDLGVAKLTDLISIVDTAEGLL